MILYYAGSNLTYTLNVRSFCCVHDSYYVWSNMTNTLMLTVGFYGIMLLIAQKFFSLINFGVIVYNLCYNDDWISL